MQATCMRTFSINDIHQFLNNRECSPTLYACSPTHEATWIQVYQHEEDGQKDLLMDKGVQKYKARHITLALNLTTLKFNDSLTESLILDST